MKSFKLRDVSSNDPMIIEILDSMEKGGGHHNGIPNLYLALGNAPNMLKAWTNFAWPLRNSVSADRSLREILILRVAQVTECVYEWCHHVPMALDSGVPVSKIDAIGNWESVDCWSVRERSVLRLAGEIVAGSVSDATLLRLHEDGLSDQAVVEIVLTAAFYLCCARLIKALNIQVEDDFKKYSRSGECMLADEFE